MDKEQTLNFLVNVLKKFIIFIYSWLTTDGEILGYILGLCHAMLAFITFSLLIVSHTIYPSIWLQSIVLIILILIWIQHLVLKVCIITVAEEELTGKDAPFFAIIKDLSNFFNISLDLLITNIILIETTVIACFSLALIGRFSLLLNI